MSVVILDDDIIFTEMISEYYDLDDIACSVFNCPDNFLSTFDNLTDKCNCIIMDYNLNHAINGFDVITKLVSKFGSGEFKIILYSGNIEHLSQNERRFLNINNISKIEKPAIDKLTSSVNEHIKSCELQRVQL